MLQRMHNLHRKIFTGLSKAFPIIPTGLLSFAASLSITLPLGWMTYSYAFVLGRIVAVWVKWGIPTFRLDSTLILDFLFFTLAPVWMATPPIIHEDEEPIHAYQLEVIGVMFLLATVWAGIHVHHLRKAPERRDDIS